VTWALGALGIGAFFLAICRVRHRMDYWPIVVLFIAGDLLRSLGGRWAGLSPGVVGGAYRGDLPPVIGLALFAVYASFMIMPVVILLFSDRQSAKAAGVLVLLDGFIHLLLPVQPPWMTGASSRWAAEQHYFKFALDKDSNPLAAFPSLHAALPASQKWWLWTCAISIAVVLLGEHWVVDVVAGLALSLACRRLVARYWPEPAVRVEDQETSSSGASRALDRAA
jgi:hypothetical protein